MSQNLMSPVALFTLDSLVTLAQWTAARTGARRRTVRSAVRKAPDREAKPPKLVKPVI